MLFKCLVFPALLFSVLARSSNESIKNESDYDLNFYIENDTRILGGQGDDKSYTNGLRFSYLHATNESPAWGRTISNWIPSLERWIENSRFNFGWIIGQQMYTPENISNPNPIADDRPYAGWLYVGVLVNIQKGPWMDSLELDIGVVGPEALGEQGQKMIHQMWGIKQPEGWAHQLGTEPGVVLTYVKKNSFIEWRTKKSTIFDAIGGAGFSLGNVITSLNMGGLFRLGYHIPSDFGPSRASGADADPFIESVKSEKNGSFNAYGFLGLKGSLVGRNIFLDGNTFKSSPRVTKNPTVGESEIGLHVGYACLGVTWRQVVRTSEFYSKNGPHAFGSLGLTFSRRF